MKQHFMMFAAYNQWANGRIYDAAADLDDAEFERDVGAFFGSMMGTLNHLLVADRVWMKRFSGEGDAPASIDRIVHRALSVLRLAREAEDKRIISWIDGMSEKALAGRFSYMTLSDMRTISQRLAPALSHFFNHQTHHRGHAHMILTVLGRPSVPLDLVLFQRSEEGRAYA
ncbi:MAG: damage-inducible protein DinB [Mesorhizobium sp.]|uniref:DinB family protein n=1 Tax=unclassified Mesorhizobium TaxID=325217 RepID=UPI000F759BD8|nr:MULTISPECIES: DinB family protein [unclassified Mesorhizobium]RVD68627.1 damage-inducible protein DinB [Mesorhizobium sp. M4A.F.Ca.ET.029.04.2.1]AZO48127.1 damage-inducible protein DinB [Mesorhizobium sp. M4B.F.Ca.ET.058.02.1.1]RUX51250.1 damage-inducible protein DinB [Mesorhizobium sp. M4A.F.Ca.ET.050.02.1.1]RVC45369.1 damage-inducible protein DinB [Mesorhizobium sp. M4A.F.Ca.ET.090.04.2.1]RVC79704.1 damage-inducible protein DinB [Mesorhizobium sp. M4A.F.Ca.ET.022.05.2.1]